MTHFTSLYGERRRFGQQNSLAGKNATHLAFVLLHPSAGRLVGHHLRVKSRQVISHRDRKRKMGEAYHVCLETGPRSKWFSISSWSARYGPLRSSTPCVARCRPISSQEPASVLPRSSTPRSGDDLSAGTRPEKHGGRVSTAASSRARCLETPAGSAFESPGHRTWSRGRRWGTRGGTRGSVVCLSHYIVDLLVQERSDYISNR